MGIPLHPRRHHRPAETRLALAVLVVALAGCATRAPVPPQRADGPEARPQFDPMQVPDATPALEPIRPGGPNKPYAVNGETYTPLPPDAAWRERGVASWYGRKFHGRPTASGEPYDMYAMTAAHRTLPLPSFARVSNPANGRSAIVRVNDRGPFVAGRVIDLSYAAALKLGVSGLTTVEVVRITPEEIRSGTWLPAVVPPALPPPEAVIDGDEPPAPVAAAAANAGSVGRGYWVQLGAFRERQGAEQLQKQATAAVDGITPMTVMSGENALYRLQAGPFASRGDAQRVADRLREKLLLVPVLLERR